MCVTYDELKKKISYDPVTGVITRNNGKTETLKDKDGYIIVKINYKTYKSHRLAWLYMTSEWPEYIDHINRDKADNRWENLRNVTHRENHMNRPLQANNKSGVTGVCWAKKPKQWMATIKIKGKVIYLGQYKDKFEAICARLSANNKYGFHPNHGRG